MIKFSKWILVLTAHFFLLSVSGQSKTVNLKQLLKHSLENNLDIKQADLSVLASEAKIKQARNNILPQITADGQINDNIALTTSYLPGELAGQPGKDLEVQFGKQYNTTFNFSAKQLLFSKDYFDGLKMAKISTELNRISSLKTREEVVHQISKIYYQLLIAKRNVSILNDNITRLEKLYETTEIMYNNQVSLKTELNKIKVNLINITTNRAQTQETIDNNTNLLKLLAGYPVSSNIEFSDTTINNINSGKLIDNFDDIYSRRSDIRIIDKQLELYRKEKSKVNAGYYPTLSAFAQIGWNNQGNSFELFGSDAKWNESQVIGLKLSIPIFDGFIKKHRAAEAKIKIDQTNYNLNYVKDKASIEVINSTSTMNRSIYNIEAQLENMKLAEEVYEQTALQYKEGLATINDILLAETTLRESKNLYNQEVLRYKIAELDLLKAKGELMNLVQDDKEQ